MPLPPPLLTGTRRDYPLEYLLAATPVEPTLSEERQLMGLVLPPWQRPEVWSLSQKIRFIESVFLGLGTGYYVLNGADYAQDGTPLPMSAWLIDGQQRITAIRDFLNDEFCVFGDVMYSALERPVALKRFLRQPFPCFELEFVQDEAVLKELYFRLNYGGTAHTEADLNKLNFKD
jgi:hypothetical protein